jgi:MFS family permease
MITWAVISAATMFVKTPTMFYVVRFALGLAEAGLFPGVILYLTYWYPSKRRSKMIALFMTGIPSGRCHWRPSFWLDHAFDGRHEWLGRLAVAIPARSGALGRHGDSSYCIS